MSAPIDPRAPYLVVWAPSRANPKGSQIVLFGHRLIDYPAGADHIVLLTPAPGEVIPTAPCATCGHANRHRPIPDSRLGIESCRVHRCGCIKYVAEVIPSLPPQRLCTTCGMDRDDEDGCQCPCTCDGIVDCPRHDGQPGDEG